jgi:hypothetical protein
MELKVGWAVDNIYINYLKKPENSVFFFFFYIKIASVSPP